MKTFRVSYFYIIMTILFFGSIGLIQANQKTTSRASLYFPQDSSSRLVEDISIIVNNTSLTLTWTQVAGATSYKVYSSSDPELDFVEDLTGTFSASSWTAPVSTERRFYYVAAVTNEIQTSFVLVEGGTFSNGTSNITLSSYYISNYELTQAEYEALIGVNPSYNYNNGNNPNHPMEMISWYDVLAYCNLRSMEEDLTPCYTYLNYGYDPNGWPEGWNSTSANHVNFACDFQNNGYRLPTEMEWMFAAKGGNLSNNYTYSGSENIGDVSWYNENSGNSSHEVGTLAPNELGLYDMSGNIFELCWDIYGDYPTNDQTNPVGPNTGTHRCIRGGGWNYPFLNSRVFHRSITTPTSRGGLVGCRLVRSSMEEQIPEPEFNPTPGIYNEQLSVTITSSTPGAIIRYTLDETEPNENSDLYISPIDIFFSTVIKAKAYKNDMIPSMVAEAEYLIQPESFVLVEGGTFNNGTSNISLSTFYIDKYEVTQESYLDIMGTNPSYFTGNSNKPVENISWFNAIEYCNRRSIQENLNPCYSYDDYGSNPDEWPEDWDSHASKQHYISLLTSSNGYRLPTEMEWMFAAKGGNESSGYTYSGSNNVNDVAWYENNAYYLPEGSSNPNYGTHVVGTKGSNELGIYDMSGNVWEMCWDLWGNYPTEDQTNPTGSTSGDQRVKRGGAWCYSNELCSVSYRIETSIFANQNHIGFRCVRNTLSRQAESPTFDIPSGTYITSQYVTISSSNLGAEIRYTIDGSEPTESSLLYTSPVEILYSCTLKARVFRDDLYPSAVAQGEYNIVPDNYILVEGGTFNNGVANITLSPFYIDKYEVTQAGFEAVMGINPAHFTGNENKPVEQVSWYDAIEYCNRRSILENQDPCYSYNSYGTNPNNWPTDWKSNANNTVNITCDWSVDGYRLPTEMEWMFAAKGGNQSLDYTYSGGNNVWDVAWFNGNASLVTGGISNPDYGTHEVGSKDANELGIHDMSGNVWEWCWDNQGNLPEGDQINPLTDQSNSSKVIRGGAWQYDNLNCFVNSRAFLTNTTLSWSTGFRCVRGIHQEQVPTPSFSHPGGHGHDQFYLSITCETQGAVIKYTLDGTEPTLNSATFTSNIWITNNTILKAKAFKTGLFDSETAVFEYRIYPTNFVFVEGGSFSNGTSNVTVSSFYIDKYEMTQNSYQSVTGDNPSNYPNSSWQPNRPVENVHFVNAMIYCNKRSIAEGLTPCYEVTNYGTNPDNWPYSPYNFNIQTSWITCDWNADGYRLPTEMEWLYAAKGGNQSQNFTYSGSNNIDDVAWYESNANLTSSVGLKQANELGIYDMSGNVMEWCWDYFENYPNTPQVDPTGPTTGTTRVFKGGSHSSESWACNLGTRGHTGINYKSSNLGFRVIRIIP
ncbi:SUMF1/EgtB/PvdO family nonheme iron enzyme [bacterium]|nr:SUMF1/EgtB/PvdO family nonheme iron enzyme [bacterium]